MCGYKDKQAKYTIMGYNQSKYCILNFWVGTAIEKLLPAKPEERQRKDKVKQLAALIKGCVPDRKLEHVLTLPEKAANLCGPQPQTTRRMRRNPFQKHVEC